MLENRHHVIGNRFDHFALPFFRISQIDRSLHGLVVALFPHEVALIVSPDGSDNPSKCCSEPRALSLHRRSRCGAKPSMEPVLDILHDDVLVDVVQKIV